LNWNFHYALQAEEYHTFIRPRMQSPAEFSALGASGVNVYSETLIERKAKKRKKIKSPTHWQPWAAQTNPQCIQIGFCHEPWGVLSSMVARVATNSDNLHQDIHPCTDFPYEGKQ
jgi:hypothetical protein